MYYLYILKSLKYERHYIGITDDILKRLAKHNSGSVKSTKAYRPWMVFRKEEFLNKMTARKREIFLKKTARARVKLYTDGPIV